MFAHKSVTVNRTEREMYGHCVLEIVHDGHVHGNDKESDHVDDRHESLGNVLHDATRRVDHHAGDVDCVYRYHPW